MDNQRPVRREDTPFQERRKKDDWVNKMSTILSLVSWVVALFVWIVLDRASPEKEYAFTLRYGVEARTWWDTALLPSAFALLILALCSSIAAFIFNMLRKRRKTDKYKLSVILTGLLTTAGIVMFILRFGLNFSS